MAKTPAKEEWKEPAITHNGDLQTGPGQEMHGRVEGSFQRFLQPLHGQDLECSPYRWRNIRHYFRQISSWYDGTVEASTPGC